jgi:hypothetical protein
MRKGSLLLVVAALAVLGAVRPASGQLWRGHGYSGYEDWGGIAGAAALAGTDYRAANAARVSAQNRQMGQMVDMQRDLARQSSIRGALAAQSQNQINASLAQQQADRDMWFQNPQQPMPQPCGRSMGIPMTVGGGMGPAPAAAGFSPIEPEPEAALDVIKWPPALQDRVFASRRAEIETPYRRSPPELSAPTTADYENMVKTIDAMRAILQWQLTQGSGLVTKDYEQAKAFLEQLRKEASQRAGSAPAKQQ